MGHISKELKEIKEKTEKKLKVAKDVWPVKNKDYYILRVERGNFAPPGFIVRVARKSYFARDTIINLLKGPYNLDLRRYEVRANKVEWFMYPGEKPNPRWGQICP